MYDRVALAERASGYVAVMLKRQSRAEVSVRDGSNTRQTQADGDNTLIRSRVSRRFKRVRIWNDYADSRSLSQCHPPEILRSSSTPGSEQLPFFWSRADQLTTKAAHRQPVPCRSHPKSICFLAHFSKSILSPIGIRPHSRSLCDLALCAATGKLDEG